MVNSLPSELLMKLLLLRYATSCRSRSRSNMNSADTYFKPVAVNKLDFSPPHSHYRGVPNLGVGRYRLSNYPYNPQEQSLLPKSIRIHSMRTFMARKVSLVLL